MADDEPQHGERAAARRRGPARPGRRRRRPAAAGSGGCSRACRRARSATTRSRRCVELIGGSRRDARQQPAASRPASRTSASSSTTTSPSTRPRSSSGSTTRSRCRTSARPAWTSTRSTARPGGPAVSLRLGRHRAGAGVKLLVAHDLRRRAVDARPSDLPRNAQGRALIGDPRNDENLIIAQLHLLFIRFHNAVVDDVCARAARCAARELLRRGAADRALALPVDRGARVPAPHRRRRHGATGARRRPASTAAGRTPAICAGARALHPGRVLRRGVPLRPQHGARLLRASTRERPASAAPPAPESFPRPARRAGEHLTGFRPLPAAARDRLGALLRAARRVGRRSRSSAHRHAAWRSAVAAAGRDRRRALAAAAEPARGRALGLPSGQDVARAMGEHAADPSEHLRSRAPSARRRACAPSLERSTAALVLRPRARRPALLRPGGRHLGPVGGRIVAEVLVGCSRATRIPTSPGAGVDARAARRRTGDFTMADLVRVHQRARSAARCRTADALVGAATHLELEQWTSPTPCTAPRPPS